MPTTPIAAAAGRVATGAAWLVAVLAVALGAAGLITAADSAADRQDTLGLAYRADATVAPRLEAIAGSLAILAADVDSLGLQARSALSALNGGQSDQVEAAIALGDTFLASIEARSRSIAADLDSVPVVGQPEAPLSVSPAVRSRYADLRSALASTDGLAADWDRLTTGAAAAGRLALELAAHDSLVGEAAAQGRAAKYTDAIATLKEAAASIADSRAARDRLAATVDVSVLDQWLDRNETYDHALSALYEATASVKGKITPAERAKLQKAIAAEAAARSRLPPDARGLVVIMGQIGQGVLNGIVVAIEEAKAELAAASAPSSSPSPS